MLPCLPSPHFITSSLPLQDLLIPRGLNKHEASGGVSSHARWHLSSLLLLLESSEEAQKGLLETRGQANGQHHGSEAIADHRSQNVAARWLKLHQSSSLICFSIEAWVIEMVVVADCHIMRWFVIHRAKDQWHKGKYLWGMGNRAPIRRAQYKRISQWPDKTLILIQEPIFRLTLQSEIY